MKAWILLSVLVVVAVASVAQPALAECSTCTSPLAHGIADKILAAVDSASPNREQVNASNGPQAVTNAQALRAMTAITARRVVGGVVSSIKPVLERVENRTVYRLNKTDIVAIARNVRAIIRPVTAELEHIKINGTSLIVKNLTNPALQITMVIRKADGVLEKNMTITRTREGNRLNLTVRNVTAFTEHEVIFDNGTIYISRLNKTIELKTTPDMVRERIRERLAERAQIREMTLNAAQNRLKYLVRTMARRRFLGIFDVDVDEETDVDADTGEIEATRGPWWGFLAW